MEDLARQIGVRLAHRVLGPAVMTVAGIPPAEPRVAVDVGAVGAAAVHDVWLSRGMAGRPPAGAVARQRRALGVAGTRDAVGRAARAHAVVRVVQDAAGQRRRRGGCSG